MTAICAALSLISIALMSARFVQVQTHRPVAAFRQAPAQTVTLPKAYTPKSATARAAEQRRKKRPPIELGVLDQAALARYCVATTGPLTTALLQDGVWLCKPLLGAARKANLTAACRLTFDDDTAFAKQPGRRCLKAGAA